MLGTILPFNNRTLSEVQVPGPTFFVLSLAVRIAASLPANMPVALELKRTDPILEDMTGDIRKMLLKATAAGYI